MSGRGMLARRRRLLEWGSEHLTDYPWRRSRDPWAVLVSELMLQQTQVARVLPRYGAFLARFPDPATAASAPVAELIRWWEGLGYNRRAVQLHRCAQRVVDEHGGVLPRGREELQALPGIGPYTARAVRAFAFEADEAPVDTNVGRVLARWEGRPLGSSEAQALADALVPRGRAWMWSQSIFELGGRVCPKRVPACDDCPVRRWCAWGSAGAGGPDPAVGSAAVGRRQARFAGSDREGRGRLVAALRSGAVRDDPVVLAELMGWPADHERAVRVAAGVVADGLAIRRTRPPTLRLP